MKEQLKWLPLEVWVDIFSFPWISRQEFGRIVDRIGNFQFAEHAQFFLHDWGKRKLCDVHFNKEGLYRHVGGRYPKLTYLDIPQTPMPTNIKSFGQIQIVHFDVNTIHFLGLIGSLLTADLKFNLQCTSNSRWKCEENLRTILTNLAPLLLDGVHSLSFSAGHVGYKADWTFPMVKQYFGEQLANVKKVLEIFVSVHELQQENVNTMMSWLTRGGNGPKLLKVFFPDFDARFPAQIFAAIREQFLAATTPCTFAVHASVAMLARLPPSKFAEFHLENAIGEQLHGQLTDDRTFGKVEEGCVFQITRHQANHGTDLQEWVEANRYSMRYGDGQIAICYTPTIGSLDAAQRVDVEEQNVQQQPSTSSSSAR